MFACVRGEKKERKKPNEYYKKTKSKTTTERLQKN